MRIQSIILAVVMLFAAVHLWAGEVINLNTATIDQLQTLPGIGPGRAEAIVHYREQHGGFAKVEELDQVPGIGPSLINRLHDRVTVAAAPAQQKITGTAPAIGSDGSWRGRVD